MNNPGTSHNSQGNAGVGIRRAYALAPTTVGAGVGGSAVYVDGSAISRVDPDVALSASPSVPAHCVLASGHNVVFKRVIQHRSSSTDPWADYGTQPDDVTVTANNDGSAIDLDLGDPNLNNAGTGGSVSGGDKWDVDLAGAKQQVRLRIRPTLSASGVDSVKFAGSVALAGFDQVPPAGV